jgi:hypothetical protein
LRIFADVQHLHEGAAGISDVDAVDVGRSAQHPDHEVRLGLGIGRRLGRQELHGGSDRGDRISFFEEAAIAIQGFVAEQRHLLFGGGDRLAAALPVSQQHQRHRNADQQHDDDHAEMDPQRLRPTPSDRRRGPLGARRVGGICLDGERSHIRGLRLAGLD